MALLVLLLPYFREDKILKEEAKKAKNTLFYTRHLFFFFVVLALCFYFLPKSLHSLEKENVSSDFSNITNSKRLPASILFDSNFSGTFGIYTIKRGAERPEKIVDTELHEMFPDPSPDGKYIVFAKSKSLVRFAPSEVWRAKY